MNPQTASLSPTVSHFTDAIRGEENKRIAREMVSKLSQSVKMAIGETNSLSYRASADAVGALGSWGVDVASRYAIKYVGFKDGQVANAGAGFTGWIGKNARFVKGGLGIAIGVGSYVADGVMHNPADMSWGRRAIQTGAVVTTINGLDAILTPLLGLPSF